MQGANFAYLTDDHLVCQGAAYLHGVIVNASSSGGSIDIYEGQDKGSGRKIATLRAFEDQTKTFNFPGGIYCQRGIFIDSVSHIDNFTVIWSRPEKAPAAG